MAKMFSSRAPTTLPVVAVRPGIASRIWAEVRPLNVQRCATGEDTSPLQKQRGIGIAGEMRLVLPLGHHPECGTGAAVSSREKMRIPRRCAIKFFGHHVLVPLGGRLYIWERIY